MEFYIRESSEFLKCYQEKLFTDVTLKVSGKVFPAHRLILSSISSFFHTAFTGKFKDSLEAIFELKDIDPVLFGMFLHGIYGAKVEAKNWYEVIKYYRMFRFFLIQPLDSFKKVLYKCQVPKEDFHDFVEAFDENMSVIASKLKEEVDLSQYSDEFIEELMDNTNYCPISEVHTYNMIANLIERGRDVSLWRLLEISYLPKRMQECIPAQVKIIAKHCIRTTLPENIRYEADNKSSLKMSSISTVIIEDIIDNKTIVRMGNPGNVYEREAIFIVKPIDLVKGSVIKITHYEMNRGGIVRIFGYGKY